MAEAPGQNAVVTGAAGGMGQLDQPRHVQIAEMLILPVNRY